MCFLLELSADKNVQRGNEFYENEEEGDRNVTLHREATPPKRARSKSPRPQSNGKRICHVLKITLLYIS